MRREMKVMFSAKPYLVTLAMGELLTCTACLIFSWQILTVNPKLDNVPALLGYIAAIFGGTAAAAAIYGTSCSKPAWLLVHCVVNTITMALVIPTISAHVYVLAATADGTRGILSDETMFVTRRMAWRIATQIILFTMLTMMMFTTNVQASHLHKKLENEIALQQRLDHYVSTEQWRRLMHKDAAENSVIIRL